MLKNQKFQNLNQKLENSKQKSKNRIMITRIYREKCIFNVRNLQYWNNNNFYKNKIALNYRVKSQCQIQTVNRYKNCIGVKQVMYVNTNKKALKSRNKK